MKAATAVLVALGLAMSTRAIAQPKQGPVKVDCTWFEVSGSTTKGAGLTVDKDLAPIDKKLHQKAFSSWNTFKKLAGDTAVLEKLKQNTLGLKRGAASLMLSELVGKSQLRLKVTMDDVNHKRIVDTTAVLEAGDYIVWANEEKTGDAHLLAVSCK